MRVLTTLRQGSLQRKMRLKESSSCGPADQYSKPYLIFGQSDIFTGSSGSVLQHIHKHDENTVYTCKRYIQNEHFL